MKNQNNFPARVASGFLARLLRDRAGNTLAMIAAAILPLMAMVGGGVDMGRSYLAQSRLQQACDAGVLAARKKLGSTRLDGSESSEEMLAAAELASEDAAAGSMSEQVADIGQRFFNINFRDGSYSTRKREFVMTLDEDYAISGHATVEVPTTIMQVFGYDKVDIAVDCKAQLNFTNTDVMMVLDVTGSMNWTNPDDEDSRLEVLKSTIRNFHQQLEQAKQAGAEMRYGFVPYSTNVNVGDLLEDDWVVDNWGYQSRTLDAISLGVTNHTFTSISDVVQGTLQETVTGTYAASNFFGIKYCPSKPANTLVHTNQLISETTSEWAGPPAGTQTKKAFYGNYDGDEYYTTIKGNTCTVHKKSYDEYKVVFYEYTQPKYDNLGIWKYRRVNFDVSDWRTTSNGCIEERDTYRINDYDNVDLDRALDLDIDRVPDSGDPKTQWRPQYPGVIYAREKKWDYTGSFTNSTKVTSEEYVAPYWANVAACPTPAQKLRTMTTEELNVYLSTLVARGSTYHDIGMIWGGRLLSPTGIFRSENEGSRSRHLIYLTDGYTSPLDLSYTTYGLDPIDQRRWREGDDLSLAQTIEKRFAFACDEVKKKNITVWVIAFGVEPNEAMVACAGPGRYFTATNATELNVSFGTIAREMSELRIEQ